MRYARALLCWFGWHVTGRLVARGRRFASHFCSHCFRTFRKKLRR